MQLVLTFVVLLSMLNVISGTGTFLLQKCGKTITINNAYNEIHLSNSGDHFKDGKKITCDVWFVSGVPNTTISVKFPSYDIAIDGDLQSDWPSSVLSAGISIPGAPHARDDDGILVYDMVGKKYMLGRSETRWVGTKGTTWDFASGGGVQQKDYQYYNSYLGKMKDMETVKKSTKRAKVYVSYKGEPKKDSFTMVIGLVGLPTTTPPPTTTTTISTTPRPTTTRKTTRKTTTAEIIDLAGGKKIMVVPDGDSHVDHQDDDAASFFPYAIAGIVVVVVAVLGIGLRCYIIRRRDGRMLGYRSDQAGLLT